MGHLRVQHRYECTDRRGRARIGERGSYIDRVAERRDGPEVGYPGLTGTGDVEDVLAAGHLTQAPGSTDQNARTVAAARHALIDVQENAGTLARLLTTAETALLALRAGI